MYKGIEYIYNNTKYSHIYKVDDDFHLINLNTNNEIFKLDYYGNNIIRDIDPKYHFGKCKDINLNKTLYSGEFFYQYATHVRINCAGCIIITYRNALR